MNDKTDIAEQQKPAAVFRSYLEKHKTQLGLALPKHLNPDRMARLALTAFNTSSQLQNCDPVSVFASVVLASQMGLEIGVNGQGYLVPYKGKATFVPGWKGIVDLVSRTGRASVWTGAVFKGDDFEYALGDRPFCTHRPKGEDDPDLITHVYAVGRVNGSEWPVIEVWPIERVRKHFKKFNKVGDRHYAWQNWEMYARKIPLLQVCKYMPSSVELTAALTIDHAHETGKGFTYDGEFVTLEATADDAGEQQNTGRGTAGLKDKVSGTDKPKGDAPAEKVKVDEETGEVLEGSNAKPAAQAEPEPAERATRRRAPPPIE